MIMRKKTVSKSSDRFAQIRYTRNDRQKKNGMLSL